MNEETILTLNKILPVVDRVHGEHHPELHQVLALYEELKQSPSKELFEKLRGLEQKKTDPAGSKKDCSFRPEKAGTTAFVICSSLLHSKKIRRYFPCYYPAPTK